jgi:hypothetical protein
MPLRRVLVALALLAGSLVVVSAHAVGETPPAPRRIVSLRPLAKINCPFMSLAGWYNSIRRGTCPA